jgi:predicted extracellular nuclease
VDGSKNPGDTKMGDYLGDVSGIVSNAFGFYRVLPLEAIAPVQNATADHPAVSFQSQGKCQGLTFANYNARNLDPKSKFLPGVASQIVDKMTTPDVIFLQEIQDNSGEEDDGVVAGNQTLAALSTAIEEASGVVYDFVEVVPADNEDGGAPGGNIRQAYLYRSDVVELWEPKQGSASDANEVLKNGKLKFNPGRIDPENSAWEDSRKPLVAAWKPKKGNGKPFFTVNVHFGSKGGSSTLHGDPRPPVNKGVDIRTKQAEVTGVSLMPLQ